uniref:BTB domain-containing protein n=1 Tax=Panagrolaimus sp. ES5 TaxID=591445 RepID=A0AC34FRV4_9BILA
MALKDSENAIEKYVYDANIPGLRYYIRIYPNGFNEESRGETWILLNGIESPLDIECKFKKFDLMELSDSEGGFLFGKCFYAFNNPGIQHYIEICKTGDKDEERRGETWIFLRMNGSAKRNITTEFTISVESANFSRNLYHVYETHEAWGIACCKTVDFFDTNRKFFVDGEITVKVKGFLKAERSLKIPCPISMQWKIKEDDLKAKKESNGYLRSKRFNILSFSNVKYFLSVYPNFKKVKNLAETHLFLNIELGAEKAVEAMYDFSIETANFCYITQYIFQKSTGIGTILCPVDDLFNKFKGYIVDGFLTINFNGILMIEKDRAALELNCINGLEIDAMQCYQEKDFTIIVGEKEIKAHKKVLMNASPVFTGMFESGMKESIENKMVIEEEEFSFE